MVRMGLQIKALLDNIEKLETTHPDYPFFLKIKCTNCGEESEKWHAITESERMQSPQSTRNVDGVNFYMKCKMCGRENSIDIEEKSNAAYTVDQNNTYQTIVVFECRGVELIGFSPRTGFTAEAIESGTKYTDIDLSEDDWLDFDMESKKPVSVSEFEYKFLKLKNR